VYQAGAKFEWDTIRDAGMEQSLFSSRKIVDLRLPTGKPGAAGAKILTELAKTPDADVLLIVSCDEWDTSSRNSKWAATLATAGVLVEIWPVKSQELPAWIDRRMKVAGLAADREALVLLAELVEGNLLAAQQEIDKLVLLGSSGKITVDLIRESVGNSSRFDAFRLTECLLAGRADDCLRVASGLRRTGVVIQIVTAALSYQLGQLNEVHNAIANGENEARAFGRFRVFKMNQPLFRLALRRVSGKQLGDTFRALSLVDRQSKGRAAGDPWQTLDSMILGFCLGLSGDQATHRMRG
jgi:DNA polymerase-3 subunit delta